jgi:hypothetical protein
VADPSAALPPYEPPKGWAVNWFDGYFRRLFRKHFHSTRLATQDDPAAWDPAIPTLLVANHSTWWDGFFVWMLSRAMGRQAHILMEAKNLAKYGAFRWIGVKPMRRDSLMGAYEDLMAARSCLRPETILWIFPQGARRPVLERPTQLERGAAQLALAYGKPVRLGAVALRFHYIGEQLPEAFALASKTWILRPESGLDRRALTEQLGDLLRQTLDQLDARLAEERVEDFRVLVEGKLSVNKRADRLRHATGLLEGEFEARNG